MAGGELGAWARSVLHGLVADAGPPGWSRPPPGAPGMRADVLGGLLVALSGVLSVLLGRAAGLSMEHRPGVVEELVWALAATLPLCVRRRYPQTVLAVVTIAFVGLQVRGVVETVGSQIALFLAIYTVGAWGRERVLARWSRGLVVAAMFALLAWSFTTYAWDGYVDEHRAAGPLPAKVAMALLTAFLNVLYFGAAWALGDFAWHSAGQRALLEQRNAELVVERDENARRAVLDERVRIARELHDVVAHHVSVMGVQAGAARVVLDADPPAARRALGAVEQSARHAVEEMRRLLGVLRESSPNPRSPALTEPAVPAPVPGLDGLPELVAASSSAGLRAEFTVVGTPVPVPSGMSVSVYRIVQEALTNTVRHAFATRVDVRLRYLTEPVAAVEAEIVDDGRPVDATPRPAAGPGTGHPRGAGRGLGLVGMRERAALHDGELETGPRPGGGYRVRVRVPLGARRPVGAASGAASASGAVTSGAGGRAAP